VAATLAIATTMVATASPVLANFLDHQPALAVILAQPTIVTLPLAVVVMVGVSLAWPRPPAGAATTMLQMHLPERLGLRRDYIREP
jgi:Na+/H+ antiporter NhaD/arsenite permease-like protein